MTLTELSFYSRKMAPFAVLFLLIFLIMFYSIKIMLLVSKPKVSQSMPINPIFGKIGKPLLQEASSSAGIKFTLDTIEGIPTTATDTAKVFFQTPNKTLLSYREKIYLIAKTLGFDTGTVKHQLINNTEALFDNGTQKLTIDIGNFNYSYEYKTASPEGLFQDAIIPSDTEIENKAKDFFNSIGRYPEELAKGKTNIIYLNYNITDNSLGVVQDAQSANVVEVDFHLPDIDNYPIVSSRYFTSQNYVIMVFKQDDFKILKSQLKYFEKSSDQVGVYPVKIGDMAWNELIGGKGVVLVNNTNLTDVVIKKMFLAYLEPDTYQEYLQPVYIFLGEGEFAAYVPAITNEYLLE